MVARREGVNGRDRHRRPPQGWKTTPGHGGDAVARACRRTGGPAGSSNTFLTGRGAGRGPSFRPRGFWMAAATIGGPQGGGRFGRRSRGRHARTHRRTSVASSERRHPPCAGSPAFRRRPPGHRDRRTATLPSYPDKLGEGRAYHPADPANSRRLPWRSHCLSASSMRRRLAAPWRGSARAPRARASRSLAP